MDCAGEHFDGVTGVIGDRGEEAEPSMSISRRQGRGRGGGWRWRWAAGRASLRVDVFQQFSLLSRVHIFLVHVHIGNHARFSKIGRHRE